MPLYVFMWPFIWDIQLFVVRMKTYYIFLMFIFERETHRERERWSVSRGGAETEGDTESEAGSRL